MTNAAPYRGFPPLDFDAFESIKDDEVAVEALVFLARGFMLDEAPRMAVAAGLLPNVHRSVDAETAEEGCGELAHRILVSRKLQASFVVFPAVLSGTRAKDFVEVVVPDGKHLVIAASGYEDEARRALTARWPGTLTLLTFAGTETDHQDDLYEGS